MAMSRFLLLELLLVLAVLTVWSKTKKPKFHLHRSLFYKHAPQHTHRMQNDYKPIIPVYLEGKAAPVFGTSEEPKVKLGTMGMTVPLHELLVRIYNNGQFLCVGTLITERLIATAATCFVNVEVRDLTAKTFHNANEVMPVMQKNSSEFFTVDSETMLSVLELSNPAGNSSVTLSPAQLCDTTLKPRFVVQLTTYIRTRHSIHTQTTEVLPLADCRKVMDDPGGKVVRDTMICIKNTKYSSKCQKTFGNPLIYNGMICGINVMGHNCPRAFGVDVYDIVFNSADFVGEKMKFIINADLEKDII